MFDFLDKTGLKAVLEQIKAKFPSSLPANGGNADTVGGLHANDFTQIIDFGYTETDTKTAIGQSGKTTIYRCINWTDYPAEFIDSQGVIITVNYNGSGTVETGFIWCTQIIVNPRSGNKMFIRYIDSTYVSDWKEISTQPIKSVQVGGTTNEYGNFLLWDGENNKIPICVESNGYHAYTYMMNVIYSDNTTKKMYFISMDNSGTPVQNKSVTATVYYIEI